MPVNQPVTTSTSAVCGRGRPGQSNLADGEGGENASGRVVITGFAKFAKIQTKARMGRNPATGAAIKIKASKKARITPRKGFKDIVLGAAPAPKLTKPAPPKAASKTTARTAAARTTAAKAPAARTRTTKATTTRKAPARSTTKR
jgi:DNA-binding protein HU-beta